MFTLDCRSMRMFILVSIGLLANEANLHSKNIGGLTALKIAEELDVQPETISVLKDAGAK